MSFLAGRLAGKEGAFFFQESKHAVNRLAEKSRPSTASSSFESPSAATSANESQADALPEVLRHSLPPSIYGKPSNLSTPSLSRTSKWALQPNGGPSSGAPPDALNPLRAYVSLPQVTFGPKRWEMPSQEHSVMASTANEMRKDRYAPVNPEKLKAAAEGLTQIGKAFAVATAMVFGGATLLFGLAASKLQLHNSDDIRTKGKDLVRPKFEMIRDKLVPLRTWAVDASKKWHLDREEDIKEKPIIKELSKMLSAKAAD